MTHGMERNPENLPLRRRQYTQRTVHPPAIALGFRRVRPFEQEFHHGEKAEILRSVASSDHGGSDGAGIRTVPVDEAVKVEAFAQDHVSPMKLVTFDGPV